MRKIILMAAVALTMAATGANAQNKYVDVKPFEFEVGVGMAAGGKSDGTKATPGAALFIEGRYNIGSTPFDIGLQGYLGSYDRDGVMVGGQRLDMHIMPRLVTVYGDYNFRQWRRVSLFGGVGVGYAHVINQRQGETGFGIGNTVRDNFFAVTPRIGAEFFNHLRFTVDYKIISKDYSFFGVNLSFAFGGGVRK
jgi:opacity protein-like surface antigen